MALGYTNTNKAIREHVRERYKVKYDDIKGNVSLPLHSYTIFLTEPGFYELIFSSKLPHAEAFQDWVFSEVLPSIRRTGSYTLRDPIEKLQSITLDDFSAYGGDQRKKYKTILKTHANMLKEPVAVERGHHGGLKAQENRQKLVEFKNMFSGLFEALFGPDD